jgi:Uma2 family endonuclease
MSTAVSPKPKRPRIELLKSDGEPLESAWHVTAMYLLFDVARFHFQSRRDVYSAVNMFVYSPEQAEAVRHEVEAELAGQRVRRRAYRGPDYFFVDNVDGTWERKYWVVWEENNRYPDLIVELISPKTARTDRTTKKRIYEQIFRTREYFCYDPRSHLCEGWRLAPTGRYRQIKADSRGRLWSEVFQLWFGTWEGAHLLAHGIYPRFFTRDGKVVPTFAEAAQQNAAVAQRHAEAAQRHAEAAQQHAEAAQQQAEAALQQAEAAERRAQSEAEQAKCAEERATLAEQELARVRARLAELEVQRPANGKKNGRA